MKSLILALALLGSSVQAQTIYLNVPALSYENGQVEPAQSIPFVDWADKTAYQWCVDAARVMGSYGVTKVTCRSTPNAPVIGLQNS